MIEAPANVRPYFVPADLDFDALPSAVQLAVQELLEPAYAALVLAAPDALERAAAASFVCLLFLELLEQFDLGNQIAHRVRQQAETISPREVDLNRYLRLLGSKQKAAAFLQRVRELRARKGFPPADSVIPE